MRNQKIKFIVAFIIIILFTWIDYQYFNEGEGSKFVPPNVRQIAHFVLLIPVALSGFWVWRYQPYKWIHRLWNISYFSLLALLLIAGILQWKFQLFNEFFLDKIRLLRLVFCSPLPFLSLLLIIWLIRTKKLGI